jgi:MarC family membrane protein
VDTHQVDVYVVVDIFLLLLIGVGPKIALVPFLDLTGGLDAATRARVTRTMLTTAGVVALILVVFGELLRRLLHFSTGALSIAGGIVLLMIALLMIRGPAPESSGHHGSEEGEGRDPLQMAVFPLAVPYLLNPAGIVVLVTLSADADSLGLFAAVLGALAAVLALDVAVFRFANRVSEHLDEGRMLITEKVFGFLLAALAVQLALNGLDDVGVITLAR